MLTIEDYRKAIYKRYEEVKDGDFAEYLLQPTPARFKKISIFLTDDLSPADKKIYGKFFRDENCTVKVIESFDTDKFKPICNFVKGASQLTSLNSLDLLAVLIALEARPFVKFRKEGIPVSHNLGQQADNRVNDDKRNGKLFTVNEVKVVEDKESDNPNFEEYLALVQKKKPEMSITQAFFFGMITFAVLLVSFGYFYFSRRRFGNSGK